MHPKRLLISAAIIAACGAAWMVHSSDARPVQTSSNQLHFQVVNDLTGASVPKPWICMAQQSDSDGNGKLDAVSGFGTGSGTLTLKKLKHGPVELFAHAPNLRRNIEFVVAGPQGFQDPYTVAMIPNAELDYWGRLTGGAYVSGARVMTETGHVVGIADPSGLFVASLPQGEHTLVVDSPFVRRRTWSFNLAQNSNSGNPSLVPVQQATPVDQEFTAVHASGAPVNPDEVTALGAHAGESWQVAAAQSTGWTLDLDLSRPRVFFAMDSTGWGLTQAPSDGSPALVTIQDAALGTLDAEFTTTPSAPPAGWGSYSLYIDPLRTFDLAYGLIRIGSGDVPTNGILQLPLPTGEYILEWETGTFLDRQAVSITAGSVSYAPMLGTGTVSSYPSPGASPGAGIVGGFVKAMTGTYQSSKVMLVDTTDLTILHEVVPSPDGRFMMQGIPVGHYNLACTGQSTAQQNLVQAEGMPIIEVIDGQVTPVTVPLYQNPCLIVTVGLLTDTHEHGGYMRYADVVLRDSSGNEVDRAKTDEAGRVVFATVPTAATTIDIDVPNYVLRVIVPAIDISTQSLRGEYLVAVKKN